LKLLTSLVIAFAALPLGALAQVKVAAVNAPLAYFAETIGQDAVEVIYPVPDGTDPALWRPGIADIATIQAADVILLNGADFAAWTTKTSLPRAHVTVTSAGFEDRYISTGEGVTHSHGNDGEHSHTGTASLTWLDFAQASQQMRSVQTALARAVPDQASVFAANADALERELAALDARARELGARLSGKSLVAMHPGLEYFARAYGLDLRLVTWLPGEEPDQQERDALSAVLAERPADLSIWSEEPDGAAAAEIAQKGLVSVVFAPGSGLRGDFLALMRDNLDRLALAADLPE